MIAEIGEDHRVAVLYAGALQVRDQAVGELGRAIGDRADHLGAGHQIDEIGIVGGRVELDLGELALLEQELAGQHLDRVAARIDEQARADRGFILQAGGGGGVAADLDPLRFRIGVSRVKHFAGQEAVAKQEQQMRAAAGRGGDRRLFLAQPAGIGAEQRAEHVMAEREGRIVLGAQRQQRTLRLEGRAGDADIGMDQRTRRRFEAQPGLGDRIKLDKVAAVVAERIGRDLVGDMIVAQVQDFVRRGAQCFQHRLEQAVALVHAVRAGRENAVDLVRDALAHRAGDQRAQLGFAQIGVGDDDDLQAARLGVVDQVHDRLEAVAMARFRLELRRDRCGRIAARTQAVVNLFDRDFEAIAEQLGVLARRTLRTATRLDRPSGEVEIGEHIHRRRGIAPHQRVETVEREIADGVRRLIEQGAEFGRAQLDFHLGPSKIWAPYRQRWLISF